MYEYNYSHANEPDLAWPYTTSTNGTWIPEQLILKGTFIQPPNFLHSSVVRPPSSAARVEESFDLLNRHENHGTDAARGRLGSSDSQ